MKWFWRLYDRFWIWLLHDRIMLYIQWKEYEIGFSGRGTTALDVQPDQLKPYLPWFIRNRIDKEVKIWAKAKSDAFRQACIDVLDEDPDVEWVY